MSKIGAKVLIAALEKNGTDLVFGYPGGAILPVYDCLGKSSIRHILTRSEQAAVHAASGYARISGKVGVAVATSGPGATNMVTGIATAYMDSIPLVLITGQVSTDMIGTDAFQEVDITGITQPIVKHSYLVKDPEEITDIVDEAFHIAGTGRKGPVLIDIPKNIAAGKAKGFSKGFLDLPGYQPTMKGHPNQIKSAVRLIHDAHRPLIHSGGGVISANAMEEVQALAEMIGAPVVHTLMGIGSINSNHRLSLGMPGLHGNPGANYAMSECDLMITIGARFDDRLTGELSRFASHGKIIHIDIDPAEIGKNVRPKIPIVGDVTLILKQLLSQLQPKENPEWLKQVDAWKSAWPPQLKKGKLTGPGIIQVLNRIAKGDAIVTTDVGQHQMFAAQFLEVKSGVSFLTSGGLGTMGYGLPAAIGAKIAAPERMVIAVTGDGSFQMNLPEMATIIDQQLDVKILLFNNHCLGLVRQLEHFYCEKAYYAVDLPGNPDFLQIAKAYGFEAFRIESPDACEEVMCAALSHPGPALIECILDKEDMVFPMVLNGSALEEMVMEENYE